MHIISPTSASLVESSSTVSGSSAGSGLSSIPLLNFNGWKILKNVHLIGCVMQRCLLAQPGLDHYIGRSILDCSFYASLTFPAPA